MDKWVSDDSVFISSSLKSSDGVAQVYKLVSGDIPLEEDSFSFIGEALDPSTIAPLVQWPRNDYIRLLHFLHTNSLMVNARGHVIRKSAAESHIIGRADDGPRTYWRCLQQILSCIIGRADDGPRTYWRCLDLLPMQDYGLPNNMVTTTENERLRNILKTTEAERRKAIEENKQLQIRIDEIEVATKKATDEIDKLRAEISEQQSNSLPISVIDDNLKKENDLLIVKLFEKSFDLCYIGPQHLSKCFVQMNELTTGWGTKFTEEMPIRGKKTMVGAEWNIYVNGNTTYAITVAPYKDQGRLMWRKAYFGWEYSYNSGRLVFKH